MCWEQYKNDVRTINQGEKYKLDLHEPVRHPTSKVDRFLSHLKINKVVIEPETVILLVSNRALLYFKEQEEKKEVENKEKN